ncbi:HNH domain-containing protein [Pseudomonas sp. P14-2025]
MRHQVKADSLSVDVYFPAIVGSKHLKTRAELKAVQSSVLSLCKTYSKALESFRPPVLQVWTDSAKEALKSCYSIGTKELSAHKDAILKSLILQSEINAQRCAYCMLNDPKTWDHYMPKDFFPEYSVYHGNLVYICYGCNQRKSSFFDGHKLIYCHPYFTVDDNYALLHCKVTVNNGRLSIQYYGGGEGALSEAGAVAHEHLERLGLIERFKGEASSTVSGLIGELRQHHPDGVSQCTLDRVLERRYSEARNKLGCNAWDSRLWHGLAACPEFVEYANSKIKLSSSPSSNGFRQSSPPAP